VVVVMRLNSCRSLVKTNIMFVCITNVNLNSSRSQIKILCSNMSEDPIGTGTLIN
jgi:hypothetical protein